MKKRLFDIEEIAEYLGVTVSALYSWVSQRKIPYVKIDKFTKFDLAAIDTWILEKSVGVGKESKQETEEELLRSVLGHKAKEKICGTCGEPKRLEDFYKDERCKDGRVKHCKKCMSKTARERNAKRKERKKAKEKEKEEKDKVPWDIGGKFEMKNKKGEIIFKDGKTFGKEGEKWLARMKKKYARRGE